MSKVLMESLKLDLPALAEMIRAKGRVKDTVLAHISPKEAALLKRRGGSGTTNPDTGLPEFFDGEDYFAGLSESAPVDTSYSQAAAAAPSAPADSSNYGINYGKAPVSTAIPLDDGYKYYPGAEMQSFQTPGISAGTQYGIQAAPPSLSPQLAQVPFGAIRGTTPQVGAVPTTTGEKDFSQQLKELVNPTNLARLGLAGGLGVFGAGQAKKGAKQAEAAKAEQQALAEPYSKRGEELVGAAERGELTPQSQQALQAYKAQQAQSVATRGGVGQLQADAATANLYNTLLANQYKYGLSIMQIGDQIALGAIKTGMQEDQLLSQATNNFYTNLAQLAAGGSIGGQTIRIGGA
jgi:hypothetical protein